MTAPVAETQVRVKLWDLPVRIIHWSFVGLMPALWWTWKYDHMSTHELLGYIMAGLLMFRLFWGLFGSTTARFGHFVRGPKAVVAYLRDLFSKEADPVVGHNPVGGWSVVLLLSLLIAQMVSGLFTQDVDGIESGPLTHYVSYDFADGARHWHGMIFNLLLAFIALHLCAILFYLVVKRDNLVGPMVTGHRRMALGIASPLFGSLWRILIGILLAGAVAKWVSVGAPLPGLGG